MIQNYTDTHQKHSDDRFWRAITNRLSTLPFLEKYFCTVTNCEPVFRKIPQVVSTLYLLSECAC